MQMPMRSNFQNLTGRVFGNLTVLEFAGMIQYGRHRRAHWVCQCSCPSANKITVVSYSLLSGTTNSCGCYKRKRIIETFFKHGMMGTPEYNSWAAMIQRCCNPKCKEYPRYGGRNIFVCDEWRNSFEAFFEHMGKRKDGTSLDRIDNEKGYFPGNCRWATDQEQNRNKRSNIMLTLNSVRKGISCWAEELGVNRSSIKSRLDRGWSEEAALTVPFRAIKPRKS